MFSGLSCIIIVLPRFKFNAMNIGIANFFLGEPCIASHSLSQIFGRTTWFLL